MAIGAEDYLDQMLVDKYAMEQVDNHKTLKSVIKADKVLELMGNYSDMSRNMLILNQKLVSSCSAIKAANATYKKVKALKMDSEDGRDESSEKSEP